MLPFFVLLVSTLVLMAIGIAGVSPFDSWTWCLRSGLALMFLLTASAHWGKRRSDLIAMVPGVFPRPDLMVSATGVLEILGGLGLLIPAVAPISAACLAAGALVVAAQAGGQCGGPAPSGNSYVTDNGVGLKFQVNRRQPFQNRQWKSKA
jgi:uncharacterized membrane protein YphA (DoxX/SURF4 family)